MKYSLYLGPNLVRISITRLSSRLAHPKSPPRKDLEEPSFFSASATRSAAFFSLSDMAEPGGMRLFRLQTFVKKKGSELDDLGQLIIDRQSSLFSCQSAREQGRKCQTIGHETFLASVPNQPAIKATFERFFSLALVMTQAWTGSKGSNSIIFHSMASSALSTAQMKVTHARSTMANWSERARAIEGRDDGRTGSGHLGRRDVVVYGSGSWP